MHTSAPNSIDATAHLAARASSSGTNASATIRSALVTEVGQFAIPDSALAMRRRTLVSSTVARPPNAKETTALAV